MRKILLLPLILLLAWTVRAEVTYMRIELLSGEEAFEIAQIGKITFSDNLMMLFDNDGKELGATSVDLIDKIVFSEDQYLAIGNVAVSSICVFPNPAKELLFIRGIEGKQTVRIFNMQGQVMQSALSVDGEASIPVGGLQNGTYLLQIGAQVVKFIKD